MGGKWKEVIRISFKGKRFHDHAFDLTALTELIQFQKMVAETAKSLWRDSNPDRERLPKHFEERTRLCLRRIEEGSAVAPLEVYISEPDQFHLFEPEPVEIKEAIAVARQVFRSIEKDEPLPSKFPKALVPEYAKLGQGLEEDETIELVDDDGEPVRVTPQMRSRWTIFKESSHENYIDVTGEVLEADLRQGRCQVWIDDKTGIAVPFSSDQEEQITDALKGHRTHRLQIKGKGAFSSQGKPLRIDEVEELKIQPIGEPVYDSSARPIEDILAELASEIPIEEWKKLPTDLTDNLDRYLYGRPKS